MRLSLRAAGREAGCSHAYLSKLIKERRLVRGADGLVELDEARAILTQADPGLRRKTVATPRSPSGRRLPPKVATPAQARDAVRLIEQVLAEEGAPVAGPIDYPAARLAETILKARAKALAIAERRRQLVPLDQVKDHVAKAFISLRRTIQRLPSRHGPEMAAALGVAPATLQAELDRAIASMLTEMSAPIVKS